MYNIKKQCNRLRQFLSHFRNVLSILQTNPYSYAEDQLKKINNTSFTFPEVIVRDASKIFDIGTGIAAKLLKSFGRAVKLLKKQGKGGKKKGIQI